MQQMLSFIVHLLYDGEGSFFGATGSHQLATCDSYGSPMTMRRPPWDS